MTIQLTHEDTNIKEAFVKVLKDDVEKGIIGSVNYTGKNGFLYAVGDQLMKIENIDEVSAFNPKTKKWVRV